MSPSATEAAPKTSAQAPNFTLSDLSGQKVSLQDFRGRVVLLDFWAIWCPPCRMSIPALEKLNKEYSSRGLQVVGVNLDEDSSGVPDFVKENSMQYPILMGAESDVSELYQVRGIPTMYLIDKNGAIVRRWIGYDPKLQKEWRQSIDNLLTS